MNVNKWLLTVMLLSKTSLVFSESLDFIVDKGFRVPLEIISQDYTLLEISPDHQHLKKHIQKVNYKVTHQDAAEIATNIIQISRCLDIDPWIMTGLIHKESSFIKTAVSPTGAAGLTQFTAIGLKEVNDQFGMRGKMGAPEIVTLYFLTQTRSCIDSEWVELWRKIDVQETDPTFYPLLKEQLKQDSANAVLYGAVLLKVYLGVITNRNSLEAEALPLSETYFQALQMYNGEEGDARVKYAKNVFKNVQIAYPEPIDFPYIKE